MKVHDLKDGESIEDSVDRHIDSAGPSEICRIVAEAKVARARYEAGEFGRPGMEGALHRIFLNCKRSREGETFGTCLVCGRTLHVPSPCVEPVCHPHIPTGGRPRICKWIMREILMRYGHEDTCGDRGDDDTGEE
jgi:hypothetical protein